MKRLMFFLIMMMCGMLFGETFFGFVKDKKNNQPIVSAIIKIDDGKYHAYSNQNGSFTIYDFSNGQHKLEIFRIGYKKKVILMNFPKKNNIEIFLEPEPAKLRGIVVSQTWAEKGSTPVTFENKNKEEIREKYFSGDANTLISDLPNVYSYTESGNSVGYSHIKMRGFDEKRIGVMVNGIPLNDPEDQQVYWVDIPDMPENVSSLQVQKGIGSSIYGVSTFGGSVNMETSRYDMTNKMNLALVYGSYHTQKLSFSINRKMFSSYALYARFSLLNSNGYRQHSASRLKSGFVSLSKLGEKSAYNINIYGGTETSEASWYASSETDLKNNHKHNPITYPNEIDDFKQPHFEFHHNYFLTDNLKLKNSLFYIYGNGYYKQKKRDRNPWDYGLSENEDDTLRIDLVRKKNVIKNQVGWIGNIEYNHKNGSFLLGSYVSFFNSNHWGEVDSISTDIESFKKGMVYYRYKGIKDYYSFYFNEKYKITDKLGINANFQNMNIFYKFKQLEEGNFKGALLNRYDVSYHFFNPSVGLYFNPNEKINYYINFAQKNREPTDSELYDLWDGPDDLGVHPLFTKCDTIYDSEGNVEYLNWKNPEVKPEKLLDFETGSDISLGFLNLKLNLFYMLFKNEIVPYGGANEDGDPIRGNAEKTIHTGMEISLAAQFPYNLYAKGNFSYNDNYYKKFIMHTWDENWNVVTKDYSNKKIAGYPDILSKINLGYKDNKLHIFTELNYFGNQYLDNENLKSRMIKPFYVINSQINYSVKNILKLKKITFGLKLNNILNKKYYTAGYYDSWYQENYYWPGAEFNLISYIRLSF